MIKCMDLENIFLIMELFMKDFELIVKSMVKELNNGQIKIIIEGYLLMDKKKVFFFKF